MRGIIINPYDQTVSVVYDDFQWVNVLHFHIQSGVRSVVPLDERNHLILDTDGPFKPDQRWWGFKGYEDMVCGGKSVIIGLTEEGAIPATGDVERIKEMVEWIEEEEAYNRLKETIGPTLFKSKDRVFVDRNGNVMPINSNTVN